MKIGWIGLGKLGLPCALVLAQHHDVWGYDPSDLPWKIMYGQAPPMREEGIGELLDGKRRIGRADSPADIVRKSDIVFVAVQTPHAPAYGGEQPMPTERRDFEYAYLVQACRDVCNEAARQARAVTLAVVSTVLPGTANRLIRPLLNRYVTLVYSPQFIAMGTTIADFRHPEFVIAGADRPQDTDILVKVFEPVHGNSRLYVTDIESAEAVKVFYNVFISAKIVFANMVMEVCHKTGADCDEVTAALSLATGRVLSPKYLRGGMGDGGACHPRDLIALSWLAQRLGLSHDLATQLAAAREEQTRWLAGLIRSYHEQTGLPVAILGKSYKPGSDLVAGSPALLLAHYLGDLMCTQYDPYADGVRAGLPVPAEAAVFAIATQHPDWRQVAFPPGSVVIDPFGYMPEQLGVTVIRIGRKV